MFYNFLQWWTWPEVFSQSKDGAGPYMISYMFYIAWALLFASLSASLVRMFAPYACGSGIPEVYMEIKRKIKYIMNFKLYLKIFR